MKHLIRARGRSRIASHNLLFWLQFSCVCFLLTGCSTPNKPYYGGDRPNILTGHRFDEPGQYRSPKTKLAIVEFDEEGRQWNSTKKQEEALLNEIASNRPRTVLIYAHGWHNDASPYSERKGGDLNDIDHLLNLMGSSTSGSTLAIYAAWRGESIRGPLRWFTLDGRRKVADRIGSSKDFQDFLGRIAVAGRRQGANVVFVGHSLGAALMEKSAHGLIASDRPEEQLPHLFLLLNNAERSAESRKHMTAINSSRRAAINVQKTSVASPLVISLTSEGDWANQRLNPLNGILNGRLKDKAMGFDSQLLTHYVWPTDEISANRDKSHSLFRRSIQPALDPTFWGIESDTKLRQYRLDSNGDLTYRGFWNFQIPRSFVAEHNDVYNGSILAVGASLFKMARPEQTGFPIGLRGLLDELKRLRKMPDSYKTTENLWKQRELLNGAALRIPPSSAKIEIILSELEPLSSPEYQHASWAHVFRQDLFRILRFAHSRAAGWSDPQLARLHSLLAKPHLANELSICGLDNSKTGTKDPSLAAFLDFVKSSKMSDR